MGGRDLRLLFEEVEALRLRLRSLELESVTQNGWLFHQPDNHSFLAAALDLQADASGALYLFSVDYVRGGRRIYHLQLYGFLQSLYLHLSAVKTCYHALSVEKAFCSTPEDQTAYNEIIELRAEAAGHPSHILTGKNRDKRVASVGPATITQADFTYRLYDVGKSVGRNKTFNYEHVLQKHLELVSRLMNCLLGIVEGRRPNRESLEQN